MRGIPSWLRLVGFAVFVLCLLGNALSALQPLPGWIKSHYVFNYHEGLAPRGVVGTLALWLGDGVVSNRLAQNLALSLLGLTFLALVVLAWLAFQRAGWGIWPVLLAVALSAGPRDLAWQIGFLENAFYPLALLPMILALSGFWPRLAVVILGTLIHEAFMLLALPLVMAEYGLWRGVWWRDARWWALGLSGVGAALVMMTFGRLPARDLVQAAAELDKLADGFSVAPSATVVLFRGAGGIWEHRYVSPDAPSLAEVATAFALTAPVFLLLALVLWRQAQHRWLMVLALCGPLMMNLLAWDYLRFQAGAVLTGFALVLVQAARGQLAPLPRWLLVLSLLVAVSGPMLRDPLRYGNYGVFPQTLVTLWQHGLQPYRDWQE